MIVTILSITVSVLVACLIAQDYRHRKLELQLLDRVLQASGASPLEPRPAAPVAPSIPPSRLAFKVR